MFKRVPSIRVPSIGVPSIGVPMIGVRGRGEKRPLVEGLLKLDDGGFLALQGGGVLKIKTR